MSGDLKRHQWFSTCLKALTARLGNGVTRRRFVQGEELFQEDAPARFALLILDGYIALSLNSEQGRKGIVDLATTSDFLGTSCVTPQALRYFTAVALTDGACLEVTRDALIHTLRTDSNFMETVLSLEVEQRRRSVAMLGSFLFLSSEQRLGRMLLMLEDTYDRSAALRQDAEQALINLQDGAARKDDRRVLPRIGHQTLADMIGTTRPRVTVFLNRFRKAGIFKQDTRVDRGKTRAYLDALGS